jgi:hypothetical protein
MHCRENVTGSRSRADAEDSGKAKPRTPCNSRPATFFFKSYAACVWRITAAPHDGGVVMCVAA